MPRKKQDARVPVGKRIRSIREEKKIPLEQMGNETGFSVDYLKQIEAGKTIPTVGALLQIARALQIDSGFFLREQESNVESRIREYVKRTENYAYTTLTPGAENKHMKAFRITIDPMEDHKGFFRHEGEEFVYVLKGRIELAVGEHINRLAEGESLLFNSGITHTLSNIGDIPAELLVVLYLP